MRNDRVSTLTNKKCDECGGFYQLFTYDVNDYLVERFVCLRCRDEKTIEVKENDGCNRKDKSLL